MAKVGHDTTWRIPTDYEHINRGFYAECPSGELSKQKLQDMYSLLLPTGIARVFVDQLFGLFDSDKSGSIDFTVIHW